MRIFVAIPLPDELKSVLRELQSPIDGIRWQSAGQLHITLRFIGDTEQEKVMELQRELQKITAQPFSLSIQGLGVFPNCRKPKIIWAGVENTEPLKKLHQKIETRCLDMGFEEETRTFKPHITLGKVKDASVGKVRKFIDEYESRLNENLQVDQFVLYESQLSPEGAEHNPIEVYSFGE